MNYIKQLATPNQLVPSLSDEVQFNFRDRNGEDDEPRSAGFDFQKTKTTGDKFGEFGNPQPVGAATKSNGDIVRFDQNKPWEGTNNSSVSGPARKFVSGENLD